MESIRECCKENIPSKPCRIRSGSILVTASYGRYGQPAARIRPESICRIRLPASVSVPLFRRRHGSYCAKPTRNRSGWSGQGLVWKQAGVQGIIGPGFWQDATVPLPVSHFQTRFRSSTDIPDNIVPNQPGSDLVLADYVKVWPNGSGPEASRCARIIRPASGQCFRADPDRIRIGSGMFTGDLLMPYHILADLLPISKSENENL